MMIYTKCLWGRLLKLTHISLIRYTFAEKFNLDYKEMTLTVGICLATLGLLV